MSKSFIISFACIFATTFSFAQIERTYHWYFGDKAGIDFSSGQPVAVTDGQMSVYEGCSAISDKHGNLLMYTDGKSVWNKNHQIMPNGTGLGMSTSTPTQSSVIVPMPGNDRFYYIFHLTTHDFKNNGRYEHGFKYSLVDMELDGELGDIIEKNVLLLEPVSEGINAVMHENCEDVWVVVHHKGTDDFYSYLVTPFGIEQPVITTIGNFKDTPFGAYQIKISSNGKKIASSAFWNHISTQIFDTLHLFDFNRHSGMLSNLILIPDTAIVAFGFSPDNSKLYIAQGDYDSWLYQYDISSGIQSSIISSKTTLYYDEYWVHADFQIARGGIMVAVKPFMQHVSIIYEPNKLGTDCHFVDSALYLNGRFGLCALPEFNKSYFDYGENSCWKTNTDNDDHGSIFIPNIFSPNGDGINDVLYVRGHNIEQLYFVVYSRWGEKLFETSDLNCGWDGTFKGKHTETGVYVYFLNATLQSGRVISKSGDVTLIR
jgi:gliding motility-associated-like protein